MAVDPSAAAHLPVGPDDPCLVIAEAGVNHDGDIDLAHQLVDVAADCGADAIKFQTFDPEQVAAADADAAPYQRRQGHVSQREMLAALALPRDAWSELAAHAGERGLRFLSTAFDRASLDLILELGVTALKVPSGELTNLPFIRTLAEHGLPLIISTGMADIDEVAAAVDAAGTASQICLLHCVTAYPSPARASNLLALRTMACRFDVPVGWSDHTTGSVTAIAAVALGARVLEKHITIDRARPGPDHAASEDPAAFDAFVRDVRLAESALGDGVKRPADDELANRQYARRSYHARRSICRGQSIHEKDVVLLRPAVGIAPAASIIGRVAARDVASGAPIRMADLI